MRTTRLLGKNDVRSVLGSIHTLNRKAINAVSPGSSGNDSSYVFLGDRFMLHSRFLRKRPLKRCIYTRGTIYAIFSVPRETTIATFSSGKDSCYGYCSVLQETAHATFSSGNDSCYVVGSSVERFMLRSRFLGKLRMLFGERLMLRVRAILAAEGSGFC